MATPVVTNTRSIRKASIPTAFMDYDTYEFTANAGQLSQKKYIYFDSAAANAKAATLLA